MTQVQEISRAEFDQLRPESSLPVPIPIKETAWFGTTDGILVGTVFMDIGDKDWNFVVLGKDQKGQHRWIDGNSSFETEDEAKRLCIAAIEKFAKSGKRSY